jgi:hypothetical protein
MEKRVLPKLSDIHVIATSPGGREARPYDTLLNLLGRGEVYPRPPKSGKATETVFDPN